MKNIKLIIALFLVFLLCSCHTVVGNWLGKYADYHLTYGEENANKGLFRVDGCYIPYTKEEFESDSIYGSWAFVFYPDGMCVQCCLGTFIKNNGTTDFDRSLYTSKTYPNQWYGMMGVYDIREDTIYCEMYQWMDILHIRTECEGYKFAIKDLCTLKSNRIGNGENYNWHFIPCTNIVYPRAKFIKDRKWIWKTKEDWLKYKESKKKQK